MIYNNIMPQYGTKVLVSLNFYWKDTHSGLLVRFWSLIIATLGFEDFIGNCDNCLYTSNPCDSFEDADAVRKLKSLLYLH